MIGSISKIRPCGHHHYYKYAHAKNTNDVKAIDDKYKQDSTDLADKVWDYPLLNLTSAVNLFRDITTGELLTINLDVPLVKNSFDYCFTTDFSHSNGNYKGNGIENVIINAPNATSFFGLVYMATNLRKFEMVGDTGKKLTSLSHFAEGTYNLTDWTHHNFSNVTNLNNAFFGSRGTNTEFKIECDFKNVTYASNSFTSKIIETMRWAYKLDENGNKIWIPQEYDENGNAIYPWTYNEFPVLIDAPSMFEGCKLDKASSLSILNSLKDWTNNTANHRFGISIQRDYKYDPEINLVCKNVGKNYTAPLEYTSVGLGEEITANKNWTLSVSYRKNVTKDEILNPDVVAEMDLDTIVLPENYTRCLNLISDGTQYIKTGYTPTTESGMWGITSTYDATMQYGAGTHMGAYGCFELSRAGGYISIYYGTNGMGFKDANNNQLNEYGGCHISTINWLGEKKATVYFDNHLKSEIDTSNKSMTFTKNNEIYLFGQHYYEDIHRFKGAIYRIKISVGTEIIRDYIPCLDDTGRPCMRDIINGINYYNSGIGADFDYKLYEN